LILILTWFLAFLSSLSFFIVIDRLHVCFYFNQALKGLTSKIISLLPKAVSNIIPATVKKHLLTTQISLSTTLIPFTEIVRMVRNTDLNELNDFNENLNLAYFFFLFRITNFFIFLFFSLFRTNFGLIWRLVNTVKWSMKAKLKRVGDFNKCRFLKK
jgi:hypothetical protein